MKNGKTYGVGGPPVDATAAVEIARLCDAGESSAAIAKQVGLPLAKVRAVLRYRSRRRETEQRQADSVRDRDRRGRPLPLHGAAESVERVKCEDCSGYQGCLDLAARAGWRQFHCEGCGAYQASGARAADMMDRPVDRDAAHFFLGGRHGHRFL